MEHELTLLDFVVRLTVVFALVFANGYFVAAEFALVASRVTRVQALAERGKRGAQIALHAIRHLDRYISGTQLGITLASLALGWFGEETLAAVLMQVFEGLPAPWDVVAGHGVAATTAFVGITFLHIVLGELAPKSLALLFPERVGLWVAGGLVVFSRVLAPFIWLLNGAANLLLRGVGLRAPTEIERVHSPEEIEMLVRQAHEYGTLAAQPRAMIEGVLDLAETTVEMVMTPRTEVVAVEVGTPLPEAARIVLEQGLSRLPVYEGDLDHVVGVVLARDLWRAIHRGGTATLRQVMRPPFFVPASKRTQPLMAEMLQTRNHMAIVLDEFGGTAGIATLEDLIEEIVGEIRDEDEVERPEIEERAPGIHSVAASVPIDEVNERLGLALPEAEHYATVGGYVLDAIGRIPRVGEELQIPGGRLKVESMRGRRIERVLITK